MPVPDSYHLFHHDPYPPPPAAPPVAHKVWLLDCGHCGLFLTNRGMKAVLLLRPNVSLYSSDALPVNCSAYSALPAAPVPALNKPPAPHRTCECLTQSLACHGCGTTIGYMIVYPCPRCTASISATNRATNGHRFVFHSNEVVGTERRYIPDEPGVIPYDPPQRPPSPVFRADFLPTPPLEFATPRFVASPAYDPVPVSPPRFARPVHLPSPAAQQYPAYRSRTVPGSRSPPPLPPLRYASRHPPNPDGDESDAFTTPSGTPPPPVHFGSSPVDYKEPPQPLPSLKRGDVVFWHHLARTGEISTVAHDERARRPAPPPRPRPILFNR